MPDYPPEIYAKAAGAITRELLSYQRHDTWMDSDEALARVALDAVAADLGEAVSAKILEHMEARGPKRLPAANDDLVNRPRNAFRRHFGIAARVAAHAFLTEGDKMRLAAEALAVGQFAACRLPEDGDERDQA